VLALDTPKFRTSTDRGAKPAAREASSRPTNPSLLVGRDGRRHRVADDGDAQARPPAFAGPFGPREPGGVDAHLDLPLRLVDEDAPRNPGTKRFPTPGSMTRRAGPDGGEEAHEALGAEEGQGQGTRRRGPGSRPGPGSASRAAEPRAWPASASPSTSSPSGTGMPAGLGVGGLRGPRGGIRAEERERDLVSSPAALVVDRRGVLHHERPAGESPREGAHRLGSTRAPAHEHEGDPVAFLCHPKPRPSHPFRPGTAPSSAGRGLVAPLAASRPRPTSAPGRRPVPQPTSHRSTDEPRLRHDGPPVRSCHAVPRLQNGQVPSDRGRPRPAARRRPRREGRRRPSDAMV